MKIKELIIVSIAFLALCNPTFGKDDKEEMRFIVDKGLNTANYNLNGWRKAYWNKKICFPVQ